jgi:hypothetical protein
MREITTNWNNPAYANETVFVDQATGFIVTIPANTPVNVRSMIDSVQSGAYFNNPTAVTASEETLATAPEDVDVVTVTLDPAIGGFPIRATTSAAGVATVSPALGRTLADGTVVFTITSVADGTATITFTAGNRTDTVVVTVTDPEA